MASASGSFLLRRVFRSRVKLFVILVCIPILILCGGLITSLRDKGHHVYDVYKQIQENGTELILQPPLSDIGEEGTFKKQEGVYKVVVRRNDTRFAHDKQKLMEKVDGYFEPRYSFPEKGKSRMVVQGGEDTDPIARERRDKVKEMILHAWRGYKQYAWGKNEVKPVSKRGHNEGLFGRQGMGATIVDSLDTLYIAGLMDEFNDAKAWVQNHLDFDKLQSDVSVFEINIRFVGGLLSAFALTGEPVFKERALQIARKLLPAFRTSSGIPYGIVHTGNGNAKNHWWSSGGSSILSEFGTLHLEFLYLSDVSGDPIFREKVFKIREVIRKNHSPGDLYPNYMSPHTGRWGERSTSIGALGDSFYEYLIKSYVQSNSKDTVAKEMYEDAVDGITNKLVRTSSSGITFLAESIGGALVNKMEHLACFAGGMYALGAASLGRADSKQHMKIAKGIAHTCHESYARTATGLGPNSFRFTVTVNSQAMRPNEKHYSLRPEAIETWFYLWRLTKQQKYRDWAWDAAMALEKHCRAEAGFSGIRDVFRTKSQKDDVQQSFLLAETLKYLYLIFSNDSLISLDEWVFNTEAHPIPIDGKNTFYRKAKETDNGSGNMIQKLPSRK